MRLSDPDDLVVAASRFGIIVVGALLLIAIGGIIAEVIIGATLWQEHDRAIADLRTIVATATPTDVRDRVQVGRDIDQLSLSARGTLAQIAGTLVQTIGGAALLAGLWFTWQNLVATQQRQSIEGFSRAVDQLCSERDDGTARIEIRLGAVYALERIARAAHEYRRPVIEMLTAYVRENASRPDHEQPETATPATAAATTPATELTVAPAQVGPTGQAGDPATAGGTPEAGAVTSPAGAAVPTAVTTPSERARREARLIIQAILTVITRHDRVGTWTDAPLNLTGTDLRGLTLPHANLQGAQLSGSCLEGTDLNQANLKGTNLSGACLKGTALEGAHLDEASLERATLDSTTLLFEATLKDASLEGADLRGARLDGTEGLVEDQILRATYDATTKFPVWIDESTTNPGSGPRRG